MVKSFEQEKREYQTKKLKKRIKHAFSIAIIALLLALAAFSESEINNVFLIVENNTDLGYPNGTGERLYNTDYYANSSPIAILLKSHAIGVNKDMDFNLSINGTVVQDVDHRTAVGAGIHEHESIYTIIPRGSNYSVRNSTDITQVEWREYPILSGKNGTLAYTPTTNNFVGGNWTIDFNSSNWYPESRQFNTLYWNNQSKPMFIDFIYRNTTQAITMNITLDVNNTNVEFRTCTTGVGIGCVVQSFSYPVPQYSSYVIRNTSSGKGNIITWLEHNLTFTPSIVNNYYNTSGGGGISFNGSAVDMNGSSFYNGSQQAGTFNHSNLTRLNSSASGHYQDSEFNMSGYNVSQVFDYNGYDLVHVQQNNTPYVRTTFDSGNNEAKFLSSTFENRNFFIQQTFSNDSTGRYNGFGAWKFGYNSTLNRVYPLKAGELIYAFFAGGYQGNWEDLNTTEITNIALANMSGGVEGVLFYVGTTNWNTSSTPTKICIYSQKRMKAGLNLMCLDEEGNITVPGLAGSGNAQLCVDSTGKPYRGSPSC